MTTPDFDKRAAEILACETPYLCDEASRFGKCWRCMSRPAVAAALREMYEKGLTDGDKKLAAVIEKVERYKP